jgi:hypothetical protein
MASAEDADTSMATPPPPPAETNGEARVEPKYAGFTRFEIELEVRLYYPRRNARLKLQLR